MEDKHDVIKEDYKGQYVAVSNELAQARMHIGLLDAKIELLGFHKLSNSSKAVERVDVKGKKYYVQEVKITAQELKMFMPSSSNLYRDIFRATADLAGRIVILHNEIERQFEMIPMYESVKYDNGIVTLSFSNKALRHITDLVENFTKLSLPIMFSFKRKGTFQLYKNLVSQIFTLPPIDRELPQEKQAYKRVEYSLTDLRMLLGYVDLTQTALRREGSKSNPNFEKMTKEDKKPRYRRFDSFDNRVLQPAIKECNETSDIYILDMKKKVAGRGGRIIGVEFYIQRNISYKEDIKKKTKVKKQPVKLSEDQIDDFLDELDDILSIKLKTKEKKMLGKIANYDLEKIKKANDVLEATGKVENVMGFLIKAIEDGYEMPKQKKKSASFSTERNIDKKQYEELEKILIGR